jgi:hypothetical protein
MMFARRVRTGVISRAAFKAKEKECRQNESPGCSENRHTVDGISIHWRREGDSEGDRMVTRPRLERGTD